MPTDALTEERADSASETLAGPPPSPSVLASMAPPVAPGDRAGRFIVLEPLGEGGMGLVWSAFDPKLDRKVALKFLRTGPGQETGGTAQTRLLREAQALARLSHPNVVAVHDVDTHRGRVFVAMELVVGETLKDWLRSRRSWRGTLRALLEAGRGLAAAHLAGIVHRDIKPSNILVGTDGRARISDFGLARPMEERPTAPSGSPLPEPGLDTAITEEGLVAGTRGYMSPEQAAGKPLDARSDVFSFCVTAYEALCGVRPSALSRHPSAMDGSETAPLRPRSGSSGSTSAQIARLPAPAAGRRPPRRLLKRLARGLQADPDQRWPSLPSLLEALEKDARPLRPWHVALVGALAVAAAGAAAVRINRDSCGAGAAAISTAWSPSDRAWLTSTFAAAAPGQPEAAERTARHLDAYAERWQAVYRSACQAMRAGTQASQLGALRLACLETRRQEAAAVVDVLRHADAAAVRKSSDAVLGLPGVSGCNETEALTAPTPPPDDGPLRLQIDQLEARLARVAAEDAVANPRAIPDAEALVAEVDRLGFAPLQASASFRLGNVYERFGDAARSRDAFFKTVVAAQRGRAEVVLGRATARLGYVLGHHFGQYEEADRWLAVSQAIIDRTPMEDAELAVLHLVSELRVEEGRIQEALAAQDRMEVLLSKGPRADDPIRYCYSADRADALFELGRIDESVRFSREALAFAVRLYGEQHPTPARLHYLLARVLVEAGQAPEARTHLDDATGYWSSADPPNPIGLVDASDIRASSYLVENRFQEALDEARRTLAMRQKLYGKETVATSFALENVGLALIGLGKPAEAIPWLERALQLRNAAGIERLSSAETMLDLARALWLTGGDKARARQLAADAEQATRIAPLGRVHREAADWLADHRRE
ncbi:MAG TPA: serine/threonine-protein kinase [Myxococcaceae bacterium]|nr:serine/threonine-protein kinase [Myxococcaceae bacterium]